MKKSVLLFIAVITGFTIIISGDSQEKPDHKPIVENVAINWWQVPVFAVDNRGNPIIDLKETDIEVWLDNRPVKAFTFYKRSFTISRELKDAPGEQKKEIQPSPLRKKKTIFLLFDVAISSVTCTNNSKEIAQQIINASE